MACHRETQKASPDRESRHWYDLAQLSKHAIGVQSLADIALMDDVLKIKRVFFNSGYANYDLCESGEFKLVPEGVVLEALREDYKQMVAWGMFDGLAPSFDDVLADVSAAQERINAAVGPIGAPLTQPPSWKRHFCPELAYASNPVMPVHPSALLGAERLCRWAFTRRVDTEGPPGRRVARDANKKTHWRATMRAAESVGQSRHPARVPRKVRAP